MYHVIYWLNLQRNRAIRDNTGGATILGMLGLGVPLLLSMSRQMMKWVFLCLREFLIMTDIRLTTLNTGGVMIPEINGVEVLLLLSTNNPWVYSLFSYQLLTVIIQGVDSDWMVHWPICCMDWYQCSTVFIFRFATEWIDSLNSTDLDVSAS